MADVSWLPWYGCLTRSRWRGDVELLLIIIVLILLFGGGGFYWRGRR
jgi:hypothetical protein